MRRERETEGGVTNKLKNTLLSFIHLKSKSEEADTEHMQLSLLFLSFLICIERTAEFV